MPRANFEHLPSSIHYDVIMSKKLRGFVKILLPISCSRNLGSGMVKDTLQHFLHGSATFLVQAGMDELWRITLPLFLCSTVSPGRDQLDVLRVPLASGREPLGIPNTRGLHVLCEGATGAKGHTAQPRPQQAQQRKSTLFPA